MTQSQEPRQLKDYNVLGVGAGRRERLLEDPTPKVLLTHPYLIPAAQRPLYESILHETLQWLKPEEVREFPKVTPKGSQELLFQLLLEDFQKEFQKTSFYLKADLPGLMMSYLEEFPWQGPLLSDHFRYFPVFLKQKYQDPRLYLIAQKEWLLSYLNFADLGSPALGEGRLFVNPSLQSLHSDFEVEEVQIKPGLFLFYFDPLFQKVRECQANVGDAAVIDLLQEERKYTFDQLVEQLLL
ncbi:MAG: hypothetical protein ACXVCD_19525, partial [Pseudobdellovibrionaceae bacterium]